MYCAYWSDCGDCGDLGDCGIYGDSKNSGDFDNCEDSGDSFLHDCINTVDSWPDADFLFTKEQCEAIQQLNVYREQYGVQPFPIPDENLCKDAQAWAERMAEANSIFHSSGSGQGSFLRHNIQLGR